MLIMSKNNETVYLLLYRPIIYTETTFFTCIFKQLTEIYNTILTRRKKLITCSFYLHIICGVHTMHIKVIYVV